MAGFKKLTKAELQTFREVKKSTGSLKKAHEAVRMHRKRIRALEIDPESLVRTAKNFGKNLRGQHVMELLEYADARHREDVGSVQSLETQVENFKPLVDPQVYLNRAIVDRIIAVAQSTSDVLYDTKRMAVLRDELKTLPLFLKTIGE
jgi:hypothetical protein